MKEQQSRRPALDGVAPSVRASIRAALASSVVSPDHGAVELFRAARESAQRERMTSAHLVEIISSTWDDVATSVGIPASERSERLAAILTRAVAWLLEAQDSN